MLDIPQHQKDETWTERRVHWMRSFKFSPPREKNLRAAALRLWSWHYRALALLGALAPAHSTR